MDKLTQGAVRQIFSGQTNINPTLQIIDVKKITPNNQQQASASDRYRLVLSDGVNFQQAMLATQLNDMIPNLTKNSIVQLQEYICNTVQNRKIVIVLALQLVSAYHEKIGSPSNVENAAAAAPAAPVAATPSPAPVAAAPQTSGGKTFGQAPQATVYGKSASVVRSDADTNYMPISSLNPYASRWTIKARCSSKGDIRRWVNQRGEGKLFSVELLDKFGGEIRATMFNDACDRFYEVFEVGKVFSVSKGQIKLANKQYARGDYEMTLNSDSVVYEVQDDRSIKNIEFNFSPIATLTQLSPGSTTDVIGVCTEMGPIGTIQTKAGKEMEKRVVTIVDDSGEGGSGKSVELTVWSEVARNPGFSAEGNPVVAVKGVKTSDFNGCSLSTTFSSQIVYGDKIEDERAFQLRGWFDSGVNAVQTISSRDGAGDIKRESALKMISEIKDENLGNNEKPDYFDLKATVSFIKKDGNFFYTACPNANCNKKVTEMNGQYTCEKCQQSFNNCDYRYLLSITVMDHTGQQWLSAFNDTAEQILGHKAEQVYQLRESNEAAFEDVFSEANFKKYRFTVRAKQETWNDETRVKCSIVRCTPTTPVEESNFLISQINQYIHSA